MAVPQILAGVQAAGAIGTLFGGQPSINWNAYNGGTSAVQNTSNQYGALGAPSLSGYGAQQATANNASNNYANYLGTNQSTNQDQAQYLGNAEQGAAQGYARANANLQNSLAARGVGNNSSIGAGAQASLANGQAASNAGNLFNYGQYSTNRMQQNLGTLSNLEQGLAGQDFSRASSTLGAQQNANNDLVNDAYRQAMANYGVAQTQQNATDSAFSNLGNSLGGLFGPKAATAQGGSGTGGYGGYGTPNALTATTAESVYPSIDPYSAGTTKPILPYGLSYP